MATEIAEAGGTIEKFIGDAVVAVFGAPAAQEDQVDRALHTALAMRSRLQDLFGDTLRLRIGVNTGDVVLGQPRVGSSFVSGDAVNVAARLEQSARPGQILVGARARSRMRARPSTSGPRRRSKRRARRKESLVAHSSALLLWISSKALRLHRPERRARRGFKTRTCVLSIAARLPSSPSSVRPASARVRSSGSSATGFPPGGQCPTNGWGAACPSGRRARTRRWARSRADIQSCSTAYLSSACCWDNQRRRDCIPWPCGSISTRPGSSSFGSSLLRDPPS